MKKTKKVIASLALAAMVATMAPINAFAATGVTTDRLAGANRFETAVKVSDQLGASTTAILAPAANANLVDALAAAPLAGKTSPILLTDNNTLTAATKAQLVKLGVTKVYVVGAISQAVVDEVNAMTGVTATVLKGANRVATAAAINAALTSPAGTFVVGYFALADALSVASFAAANNYSVVVANVDGSLPSSANLAASNVYVIGGPTLVKDVAGATRLYGADRFATNKAVLDALTFSYNKAYIANGTQGHLVDSLVASSLAASVGAPIVLTDTAMGGNAAAVAVSAKLANNAVVVALGGTTVVTDATVQKVVTGTVGTGDLAIIAVSALTDDGRVLAVDFNKATSAIDKSMVKVFNTSNLARVGVESVLLSTDGKSLEVTLYDTENASEINRLTQYTITVGSVSGNFTRPGYVDYKNAAVVTSVDTDKRTIFVNHNIAGWPKTLKVPAAMAFDFEGVIGQEVKVWFDGNDNILNFALEGNTVLYDAIEVTTALTGTAGEIELSKADKKYELDSAVKLYVDGAVVPGAAAALTLGVTFDYAKLVLNSDGDVAFINAYNWADSVIVESEDDGILYGYDEDLDTEDYVIVKDGKQIVASDIKKGDIAFYNTTAANSLGETGYIEVYNRTVTGEITAFYDTSFKVDGTIRNYGTAESLDEDGDIQAFGYDQAEEMTGTVTVYLNRSGDVVFVSGDIEAVTSNSVASILTEDLVTYASVKGSSMFTLEYLTSAGDEEATEITLKDLESITIDGTKYKIDMDGAVTAGKYTIAYNYDEGGAGTLNDATATAILLNLNAPLAAGSKTIANATKSVEIKAAAAGTTASALDNAAVQVEQNDNGKVIGLEFFTNALLSAQLDSGDSYAKIAGASKKITKDTLVYDISDPDPADIVIKKFSDVKFDISTSVNTFVYYDGNDANYIVFDTSTANDTTDISAVVTKALYDSGDLVYIKAYVGGVQVEYTADSLSGIALAKGDVVVIELDETQDLVTGVRVADATFETNGLTVTSVDLSGKKVVTTGAVSFKLTSDCQVIDVTGTDYKVKALRDLEAYVTNGRTITVVRDAANSGYVKTIVMQ